MRYLKLVYLLVGLALLGVLLHQTDLADAWGRVELMGWGFGLILAIYLAATIFDAMAWCLTCLRVPPTLRWTYWLWKVRMVGEAFNNVTPLANLGGEPVKAMLLRNHYAIPYRDGIASLILARTAFLIALVAFLACGFALMIVTGALPPAYESVAGIGLAAFTLGIGGFFLVQRFKVSTRAAGRFLPARAATRLAAAVGHVRALEEDLVHFYTRYRARFASALALSFGNWVLGAAELYYALIFLGHPVSWRDAWILESIAQLVRSATFFVPASIGAQEGAFILVTGALTGSPALGLAVAVVRRVREIVWIVWGLALGWIYHYRRPLADAAPEEANAGSRCPGTR